MTHATTDTGLMMSSLPESELQSILDIATAAAKKAGEIIVQNSSGADVTKTKANSKDLLTKSYSNNNFFTTSWLTVNFI